MVHEIIIPDEEITYYTHNLYRKETVLHSNCTIYFNFLQVCKEFIGTHNMVNYINILCFIADYQIFI